MVAESPLHLRSGFDAAAADFDALGAYLWGPIGQATVAATCPGRGDTVLDACCGTGASAIPAAIAVGPDGTVDAVDASAPMIEVLDRSATDLPQLHSHAADVLGWDHGDYEIVQAVLGIFFFPDMTAGTNHLINLAGAGGRVGFTIWRGETMEVPGRYLASAVAAVTRTDPPTPERHPLHGINHPDGYRAWLTARGLTDVDVIVHEHHLPLTDELAWLIVTGSGYRAGLAKLSPDQITAVREHYLGSLSEDRVTRFDTTTLIGIGTRPS